MSETSVWSTASSGNSIRNFSQSSKNSSKSRRKTIAYGDKSIEKELEQFRESDSVHRNNSVLFETDDDFELCTPSADNAQTLPPTQTAGPLSDVVAYVEIFSGRENRSQLFAEEIRELGASVCQRFVVSKVTHVLFREGRHTTLLRAWTKKIPVVSVLWLDSCMTNKQKVDESTYLITKDNYDMIEKQKRIRYMQPLRYFDPEVAFSDEQLKKRAKRAENRRLMKEITNFKVTVTPKAQQAVCSTGQILVEETPQQADGQYASYASRLLASNNKWASMGETCTPESLRHQMDEIKRKLANLMESPTGSESQGETLSQAIRRKLLEELKNDNIEDVVDEVIHSTPEPKVNEAEVLEIIQATPKSSMLHLKQCPVLIRRNRRLSLAPRRSLFEYGFQLKSRADSSNSESKTHSDQSPLDSEMKKTISDQSPLDLESKTSSDQSPLDLDLKKSSGQSPLGAARADWSEADRRKNAWIDSGKDVSTGTESVSVGAVVCRSVLDNPNSPIFVEMAVNTANNIDSSNCGNSGDSADLKPLPISFQNYSSVLKGEISANSRDSSENSKAPSSCHSADVYGLQPEASDSDDDDVISSNPEPFEDRATERVKVYEFDLSDPKSATDRSDDDPRERGNQESVPEPSQDRQKSKSTHIQRFINGIGSDPESAIVQSADDSCAMPPTNNQCELQMDEPAPEPHQNRRKSKSVFSRQRSVNGYVSDPKSTIARFADVLDAISPMDNPCGLQMDRPAQEPDRNRRKSESISRIKRRFVNGFGSYPRSATVQSAENSNVIPSSDNHCGHSNDEAASKPYRNRRKSRSAFSDQRSNGIGLDPKPATVQSADDPSAMSPMDSHFGRQPDEQAPEPRRNRRKSKSVTSNQQPEPISSLGKQTGGSIDDVINAVVERVMSSCLIVESIDSTADELRKKRRLFDGRVRRLSTRRKIDKIDRLNSLFDNIDDSINDNVEIIDCKRPAKTAHNRLRSSMFVMKSRLSSINRLQAGRQSSQEFKQSVSTNNRPPLKTYSKLNNIGPSSSESAEVDRMKNRRRTCALNGIVMTSMGGKSHQTRLDHWLSPTDS